MNLTRMVDCLDDQLCQDILEEHKNLYFTESIVYDTDGSKINSDARTNSQVWLPSEFEERVHKCANDALLAWSQQIAQEYPEVHHVMNLPGVKPGLETVREPFSLLRYQFSQEYKYHVDAPLFDCGEGIENPKTRLISMVIYINDDFKGGETQFHGRKYKPVKGRALVFPSNWNYPHRSCPVTEGEKLAIVTWYHPR